MESELFGHEKGAFTGATRRREGRFALADGGTLFLDEVAELPPELQVKLLRVLQEGEYEPVGSSTTQKVDVRILAATNHDLAQAVREKAFREDLFYRLNVFPIHLPPLRERGPDVVLLASAFAEQYARRMRRPLEGLSPACVRRLKSYSWPGNVRELQNVMERAVILSRDGHLDLERALPEATPEADTVARAADETPSVLTAKDLQQLERDNIVRALESTDWRVSGERGAARLLGMKPSTLSSRMKALGLARPTAR
jgi:transcriptional regulator with GAF, ATPase, and Fis domain